MPTLVTNPASVVEHIIHKEVQYDSTIEPTYNEITVDEDSYNENIGEYGINDDINLAFTVHDKQINSKKLIEGIASNSRLIPYIKDNKLVLKGINPSPLPTDILEENIINNTDIISYSNKRTAPEKVYTKVVVNYKYDYATKEFTKNTVDANYNADTATEYFEIIEDENEDENGVNIHGTEQTYDITNLGLKAEQGLPFDAHYIRDDLSAQALQEFLLLWHCNQHNILKLKLPLKYIRLNIGDYIGFDKRINDVKLFGENYVLDGELVYRNGQQILPVWMVTSTNKTLTHIDIEVIQMHNCTSTPAEIEEIVPTDTDLDPEETVLGCTDPDALNYDEYANSDDGSCEYPIPLYISSATLTIPGSYGNWKTFNSDLENPTFIIGLEALFSGTYPSTVHSIIYYYNEEKIIESFDGTVMGIPGNRLNFLGDLQYDNSMENGYIEKVFNDGYSQSLNLYMGIWGEDHDYGEFIAGDWLDNWLQHESVDSGDKLVFQNGCFQVSVKDEDGNESEKVDFPEFRIYKDYQPGDEITTEVTLLPGWNLLGLPLDSDSYEYRDVYPDIMPGTLYGFDGTYVPGTEFVRGVGYWAYVDVTGNTVVTVNGAAFEESATISLNAGWNLISSGIHQSIFLNSVIDPENIIVQGTLYGFDGTYQPGTELFPGKGYWLNANADGDITFELGT